jgi:peptidyl-prolyl cis-trans isomerase SurA
MYAQGRMASEAERSAFESKIMKEALERIIDERLEETAADKARIQVTSEEIDKAILNVAEQAKLSARELMNEVRKTGRTEQEYRDEMRRQILEGRMLQKRLQGRMRVEEEDAKQSYAKWLRELGSDTMVDARIIALRINPGSTPVDRAKREQLAADIVTRARNGEDYCKLVAEYTEDTEARSRCGSPGPRPVSDMIPQIQEVLGAMKPGQVTDPILFGNEAIVIVQLASRSKVPSFEEMRDVMTQRAMGDLMERQKKSWLLELRRSTYVDVRM